MENKWNCALMKERERKKNLQDQFFCNAGMMLAIQKENKLRMYSIEILVGKGTLHNVRAH